MKTRQQGWGLMDLSLALAIGGILMSLSVPSFRSHAHHLHTMTAELKLLQWQVSKKSPSSDAYFSYSSHRDNARVIYQARIKKPGGLGCELLTISSDLHKRPARCWPS